MSNVRRGLPDSVKSKNIISNHLVDEISHKTRTTIIRNVPVDRIMPNVHQPRKDLGDLKEMADSIREKGIIEPILVRARDRDFEIIAGERRYMAAKMAGMAEIPCIQMDISDDETLELSIIENIQRKDLNIFEVANSLKTLSERYGYTHEELSGKLGKSRVTVTELIKISSLPEDIQKECLRLNINSQTFVLELAKIENPREIMAILKQYEKNAFSREDLKEYRKNTREDPSTEKTVAKQIRFSVVSEDEKVKINFNIREKKVDRDQIIDMLEKFIDQLKSGQVPRFRE